VTNGITETAATAALVLRLPEWIGGVVATLKPAYPTIEERMHFVIELARLNVAHATGGPFGAAVFNSHTQELLAVGVNRVIATPCSAAHAEILALALAQQTIGHYDLGYGGLACELVTSAEPCAMCLGALPLFGIRRMACGASDEDVRAIGFDEGAKPPDWPAALEARNVAVSRDVCRDKARAVLQDYAESGGVIY
jgi:tRNA(Arg) A34 adenosine deaminase TadA